MPTHLSTNCNGATNQKSEKPDPRAFEGTEEMYNFINCQLPINKDFNHKLPPTVSILFFTISNAFCLLRARPKAGCTSKSLTWTIYPTIFPLRGSSNVNIARIFLKPRASFQAFKVIIILTRHPRHTNRPKGESDMSQPSHSENQNQEPNKLSIKCTYHPLKACTRRKDREGEHQAKCQHPTRQFIAGQRAIRGSTPVILAAVSYICQIFMIPARNLSCDIALIIF